MKAFASATCFLGALVAITTATTSPAAANTVMSSCWRMTNDQYYAAGLGPGMDWKILGTCHVTLTSDGSVQRIQVIKPKMDMWAKPYGPESNTTGLKPYQNPAGVWMLGLWESKAKRSAIYATQTWGN